SWRARRRRPRPTHLDPARPVPAPGGSWRPAARNGPIGGLGRRSAPPLLLLSPRRCLSGTARPFYISLAAGSASRLSYKKPPAQAKQPRRGRMRQAVGRLPRRVGGIVIMLKHIRAVSV